MGTYGNGCYRNCGTATSNDGGGGDFGFIPWVNATGATGKSQGKPMEDGTAGFTGAHVTLAAGEESEYLVLSNFKMGDSGQPDDWPSDATARATQLRIQIAEITSDPTNGASYNGSGSIVEVVEWKNGASVGVNLAGPYQDVGALNQAVNAGAASELSLFQDARDARGVPQFGLGPSSTTAEIRDNANGYAIRVKNNHATLPLTVGVPFAGRFGIWSKAAAVVVASNAADVGPAPFILRLETIGSPIGSDFLQHEVWIDYEFGGALAAAGHVIDGGCPLDGTQNGDTRLIADSLGGWVTMVKLPAGVTTWQAHLRSAVSAEGDIVTLASSTVGSITVPAQNTRAAIRYIDDSGNNANSGLDAAHPMHDIGGVFNDVGLDTIEVRTIANGTVSFNGTVNVDLNKVYFCQGNPAQPATLTGSVRWASRFKQIILEGFILDDYSQDVSCDNAGAKDWMIDCTGVVGHGTTGSLVSNGSQGIEGIGGALVNIRGLTVTEYSAFWGLHSRGVTYGNHIISDRPFTSDGLIRTTGIDDTALHQRGQLFSSICNTWECADHGPTGDFNQSFPVGCRYFAGHIYEREARYKGGCAPAAHSVDASQSNQMNVFNARFDRCQIDSDIGSHPNFGLCYVFFSNCTILGPLNNNKRAGHPDDTGDLSNLVFEIAGACEQFVLANCVLAPRRSDSNAIVARFATIGRGPQIRLINNIVAPYSGFTWSGYNFLDNDADSREIQSIQLATGNCWHVDGLFKAWDDGTGLINGVHFGSGWSAAAMVGTDVTDNLNFDVDFSSVTDFIAPSDSAAFTSGVPETGVPWDFRGIARDPDASHWIAGATSDEVAGGGGGGGGIPPTLLSASVNSLSTTYTEVWSAAVVQGTPSRTLHGASGGASIGSLSSGSGTTTLVFALSPTGVILNANVLTVDIGAASVENVSDSFPNDAITGHAVTNNVPLSGGGGGSGLPRVDRNTRIDRVDRIL